MLKPQNTRAGYTGAAGGPADLEIDLAELEAPDAERIFLDPRANTDRRQGEDPSGIPPGGCRRKGERRTMVYMKTESWWMKRNYNSNGG